MTLIINGKTYEAGELIAYVNKLEKENAELKRDKEDLIFIRNQNAKCMCEDKEKLTKAKEIINDCVCELQNILFYKMRNKERIASTLDKAEQFFSEVEK